MCFPAALGLIGAVVSGIGNAMAASAQAKSYEAQAKINERQAKLAIIKGNYDAARATERGKAVIGADVAGFSDNGLALKGTAAEVVRQAGVTSALDVAAIRYGANINSVNQTNLASVARANASAAQASVPFAFLSPIISGLGQFGTSLSGAY